MNSPELEVGIIASAVAIALGAAMPARAAEPAPAQFESSTFARGATAWASNCARCHNARDPKDFRDDQWKIIMSHMRIRAGLTGQEARDVLAFLQGSNVKTSLRLPAVPAGSAVAAGASGKVLYERTCIACHGPAGKGTIPGVPNFTDTNGRLTQSDSVLMKHVVEGFQSPGSPMAMPAKGGDPNLTEQDVVNLLRYMRATFKR